MVLVVASTVCLDSASGRAWDEWWCEMLGDVCGGGGVVLVGVYIKYLS